MSGHDSGISSVSATTMVGIAFRCALVCLRPGQGDDVCRASCRLFELVEACALPPRLIGEFTGWALAIEASAVRAVSLRPIDSLDLCSDERLAAALVAACQYDECPALRSCAAALLGSENVGRTLGATRIVAKTLRASQFMLTTVAVQTSNGTRYAN